MTLLNSFLRIGPLIVKVKEFLEPISKKLKINYRKSFYDTLSLIV